MESLAPFRYRGIVLNPWALGRKSDSLGAGDEASLIYLKTGPLPERYQVCMWRHFKDSGGTPLNS